MKYTKTSNGIYIIEVPIEDFKIVMNDSKKKTAAKDNFCNAGFFATYHENKEAFTLPVGHLVCDYNADSKWTKKYCTERGKFNGDKFTFDSSTWSYMNQFYKKSLSTLLVNEMAEIKDITTIPAGYKYAISGVPIMRNGEDVKFATYVTNQGWDGSTLYATWHIFVGLKNKTDKTIYIMSMKTTSSNMIKTAEAYKKFKALGFYDVIKLDGGGSTILKANSANKVCTLENRRINTIITFDEVKKNDTIIPDGQEDQITSKNPYRVPNVVLVQGNGYREFNKWLQWQLNHLGFDCGKVDGYFGNNTLSAVKTFQSRKGLVVDGKVGPATRTILLNS